MRNDKPRRSKKGPRTICGLALALTLMWALPTIAAAVFPNPLVYRGHRLELRGDGVLRYRNVLPIYQAALYLPPEVRDDDALRDVPRKLVVHYRVSAAAERFNQAGRDILAQNHPDRILQDIEHDLLALESLFPDPQRGDVAAIAYRPGSGVELFFNDQSLGIVGDDRFAAIYFSIWLGDRPASYTLKRALLNRS